MKKILIVAANYYPKITTKLINSTLMELGKNYEVKKLISPGVFEIPVQIAKNVHSFDAFIALGCVIKGETPHFDFICNSFNIALMQLSIDHKKPMGNGVITCLNLKQAEARVEKGKEAGKAIKMVLDNEIS